MRTIHSILLLLTYHLILAAFLLSFLDSRTLTGLFQSSITSRPTCMRTLTCWTALLVFHSLDCVLVVLLVTILLLVLVSLSSNQVWGSFVVWLSPQRLEYLAWSTPSNTLPTLALCPHHCETYCASSHNEVHAAHGHHRSCFLFARLTDCLLISQR